MVRRRGHWIELGVRDGSGWLRSGPAPKAAGVARGELQVARVILRIQPNPQQPHSATADFDLVRLEMENEVGRERWTLSLQFQFLHQIPAELIAFNPMGIVITYLQGDRATVTGDQ